MLNTFRAILFIVAVGTWIGASPAHAQVLLQINDSDPNTVIFTATLNASAASTHDFTFGDGIDLLDFFQTTITPLTADDSISGSGPQLQPSEDSLHYFGIAFDNLSGSERDVNLFSNFFFDTEDFDAGTQAFSGSLTWDLSASDHAELRAELPVDGATGDLYVGDEIDSEFGSTPVLIGTWEVVNPVSAPEPSSLALMLGGVLMLGLALRRRAQTTA